jgi:hypothetical protein
VMRLKLEWCLNFGGARLWRFSRRENMSSLLVKYSRIPEFALRNIQKKVARCTLSGDVLVGRLHKTRMSPDVCLLTFFQIQVHSG